MKLKLKNTPEQVELIKAMGSRDPGVAREAQEAFAAFLGPVIRQVLDQAATAGAIFTDSLYDEDDSPSFPLDLYYNESTNYITVWSQGMAGGLPTSTDVSAIQELKIGTYRLDSAVSFMKRYARRARLDVVSKGIERMAQEVLVKQERNAWAVVLRALAEASSKGVSSGGLGITSLKAKTHVIPAQVESLFQLHDMNRLMLLNKRINESFADGSPDNAYSDGITDLYVSPEIMMQVREFAYQPMNTRAADNTAGGTASDGIALPDNVRERIFHAAGMQEIYGVAITQLNELGSGKKYNQLFDTFDSGNIAPNGTASAHGFSESDDELLVGVDNSKGAFIRALAQQSDTGGTFSVLPDDQFLTRSDKVGFYGSLEEGRVCIDARAIVGLVV